MKTEDILNEREKTHGDFGAVSLGWRSMTSTIYERSSECNVEFNPSQSVAIEMILLKLARIACGDPNFADHWDDIAGYAMLGKGKAKGVFEPDTEWPKDIEWPKMANEPCGHQNKERKYFADTADGFKTIMTVDYCDECNKMHIVDCEQKEAKKEQFKDEFEFINKRIDNLVEWLRNISENLVKLNELKNTTSFKMEHVLKEENEQLKEELNEAEARRKDAETYWDTLRQEVQKHIDEALKLTQENMLLKNQIKDLKMERALTANQQPSNNTGTIEFYVAGYNDEVYIDFKDCQIWAQSIDEQLKDLFKYYGKLTNALGLALPLLGYGPVNVKLYIPKGLFDIWVNLPIGKYSTTNFIDYLKVNLFMSVIPYESLDGVFPKYYAQFVYESKDD